MGMGKKKSQPATPEPTVTEVEKQAYAGTNVAEQQARVDSNESATLLQTKDDELLKRQTAGMT